MKLRQLSAGLFASLLLLAGCGTPELSEPLTREYEDSIGTFKSLGNIQVASQVTHLFETEDGEVLYAFSERYDLDEYSTSVDAYGIVTTYEELDKPLFEVTRISEAEESASDEEVTKVEYRNSELGVVSQIYSNWEAETNGNLISFQIPFPVDEEETADSDEEAVKDTIDLVYIPTALNLTAEATADERSAAIKDYVLRNYADLSGLTPDSITVGTDKLTGVRYKTATGDIYVFISRAGELFELSYHYLHMDDALRIQNSNLFSAFLNDFRFIPNGEEDPETTVETSDDVSAPTVTQVEFSKFATLSSSTFTFSMSYPAAWYYVGGSTGYAFSDTEIEEVNSQAILRMDFNTGASEGTVRNGTQVSITKKIDSRSYTLTGSAEYESLMKTMLDSIQTTKAE